MKDVRIEWDPEKAARNYWLHRVSFESAAKALDDAFSVEWLDDREAYGEERINLLGMCDGKLLHVTFTMRGELFRIISARRAERHEQHYYYRENSR